MLARSVMLALAVLVCAAAPVHAAPAPQDSTLDNLVHAPGYATTELGTLGAVVEGGTGPVDMVLVSGFGLGASAFEGFMRRNADRYHMLAVTLPGFEGTSAPPMPDSGTSYGAQTWTHAAAAAVVALIKDRGLDRPVLVGHFLNGPQVVMRVAVDHPELVRAVVLLAGSPRFEPVATSPTWPKGMALDRKIQAVDHYLAPRWFKTVTNATWVNGNFKAGDYSAELARGRRFAALANAPPLPVLIRYLCEYHASDLWPELPNLEAPLLVVRPAFTAAVRADSTRSYLQAFFEEPWKGRLDGRARTETVSVERAGIMVMDDQPAVVDRKVAEFVERYGR